MKRYRNYSSSQERVDEAARQRATSSLKLSAQSRGGSRQDPAKVLEYARKSPATSIYIGSSSMGTSPILVQTATPVQVKVTKPPRKRTQESIDADSYIPSKVQGYDEEENIQMRYFELETMLRDEEMLRKKLLEQEETSKIIQESIEQWRAEGELRQRERESSPELSPIVIAEEEKEEAKEEDFDFPTRDYDYPG